MSKKIYFILLLCGCILMSCKFDSSPAGVYKGFFAVYGGAVPTPTADDGTLTVVKRPNGNFDFTLTYPGNPDVTLSDLAVTKSGGMYGYIFNGDDYSSTRTVYMTLEENSYQNGKAWYMHLDYSDSIQPYYFSFYGNRVSQ